MRIGVHKLLMNSPSDVSGLERMIDEGAIDPREIVALIGKTEGNGGANDFTRSFATLSFRLLRAPSGCSADDAAKRIAFVWSGGTEGVLSPHATVFTRSAAQPAGPAGNGLRSASRSPAILPEEVGTVAEVHEVAAATQKGAGRSWYSPPQGCALRPGQGPAADARRRSPTRTAAAPNWSPAIPMAQEAVRPRRYRSRSCGGARRNCEIGP